jgi:hypothetical protein
MLHATARLRALAAHPGSVNHHTREGRLSRPIRPVATDPNRCRRLHGRKRSVQNHPRKATRTARPWGANCYELCRALGDAREAGRRGQFLACVPIRLVAHVMLPRSNEAMILEPFTGGKVSVGLQPVGIGERLCKRGGFVAEGIFHPCQSRDVVLSSIYCTVSVTPSSPVAARTAVRLR